MSIPSRGDRHVHAEPPRQRGAAPHQRQLAAGRHRGGPARAHLTLANTGGRHGATSACEATLAFVDDQRGCSSSRPSASAPGQGAFLALDWNEAAPDDRGRLHYRAVVTPLNDGCNGAIAGHEMVENATQKTTVFIGVYEE